MGGLRSRNKGKRGERELRDLFRKHGYLKAHRTEQYCGNSEDASDVKIPECPDLHVESKRCERPKPHEWITQAERDAICTRLPIGRVAVAAWKRNHSDTIFMLSERSFFELLRRSDLPQ